MARNSPANKRQLATKKKTADTKKTGRTKTPEEMLGDYVREVCADLDGDIDRVAVDVICRLGVLSLDDPSQLHDAVDELWEHETSEKKLNAWLDRYEREKSWPRMYADLEAIEMERLTESVDAAYLLGIAVGRRLGPNALRLNGGGR